MRLRIALVRPWFGSPIALRAALLSVALGLAAVARADADLITILSAAAVEVPAKEVVASFERTTGLRVAFTFATSGQVDERIAAGAAPDIAISGADRIDALANKGAPSGEAFVRPLGSVRIGVAAAAGAPRPDLSSVAAFRQALLRAKSIAYGNPALGATTGIHFAKIIDRLGLREALAGKSVLAANGLDVMRRVASGEAELGITQISEILHIDATAYVGPLPEPLQLATTYAAWVRDPANASARALVEAMASGDGRARFRAAGFE